MMSTIHTAKHLPSGTATIPLFSLRGLDNYAPATISSLGINGIPLQRQVAYTQYATNIASFLYATSARKTITVSSQPLGLLRPAKTSIGMPSVHFTLKKNLDSDKSTQLLNALGPGASIVISGKTNIYQAPALPENAIDTIVGLCPSHFNCGRDAINPAGAVAYRFLNTVCATFLQTHTYPAFSAESDLSLVEMNFLLSGHTVFYEPTKLDDKGAKVAAFDPTVYSRVLSDIAETAGGMVDDNDVNIANIQNHRGAFASNGVDTVLKAKPCPVPQLNIGSRSSAPNLPGIVFPYFHGLIQPDAVFLHSTILAHFFQLMGKTIQECQSYFLTLRRGCGSLSTTREGMAITHLLKGISLALETQSRCYMLYEANEYKGFVLYGAQFIVFDSTKWIVPGSEAEVIDNLARLDPHESSVGKLVDKFVKLAAEEKYLGPPVTHTLFSEPKNLIDVFRGLDLKEIDDDDVREIDQFLRGLNYMGEGYWQRNPQTIVDSLKIIASEGQVELKRPTYIPSIRLPIHTKEFAALSKFGPESYSLWNERGTEIACKAVEKQATGPGKRKAGEFDLYANMPPKILVTPKPLSVAVTDMGKVMSKGSIKIDLGERAGKFRNMNVENEEMRKSIWHELVMISEGAHKQKKAKVVVTEEEEIDFDDLFFKLTHQGGVPI